MFKISSSLIMALLCFDLQATELSEDCITSMQNLYKFYYHEIQPPQNRPECPAISDHLSHKEALAMKTAISELKNHCPAPLVAKMNELLMAEK